MSNINSVITEVDLKDYLGIDYTDDMTVRNLKRAIKYADGELKESVGDNYPIDHPLTPELALLYASASYESRELTPNEDKRVRQISEKLRLVLRRRANEQTV